MEILFFLSSGLFLGWSLGANDAANVFGTAVGTKMVHFRLAAIVCSIFVILGATISGAGAAHTLGSLGSVNALAGSFMVALSAAFTVYWMTKLKLPVSTSQAIVGAIIGWNIYSASVTNTNSLAKIVGTWIICPVISAGIAAVLFLSLRSFLAKRKLHILRMDAWTRFWLLVVGAFGSYSLGANNIANVMGVFIPVNPFSDLNFYNLFTITGTQQLFFLGGLSIAVGVFTYSHKVMETVGDNLMRLSPLAALVVVLSQSIVLFLFASEGLEQFLASNGLPTIPLVPVSSSQAVVGAVIGIGLVKNIGAIRFRVLGDIATGWITTPIIAGIIAFVALFFLDNVFNQEVYRKTDYRITAEVVEYLGEKNITDPGLVNFLGKNYDNPILMQDELEKRTSLSSRKVLEVIDAGELTLYSIESGIIATKIDSEWFTLEQIQSLKSLKGSVFLYQWQFHRALEKSGDAWKLKPDTPLNKKYNKEIKLKFDYLDSVFRTETDE